MSFKSLYGALLAIASVTFASQLYNYYKRKKMQRKFIKKEVNEVIMFSYGPIKLKTSKYSRSIISPSMDRLLYYLNAPRHNLDICMYMITNSDLSKALIKLHFRGVKIRVIIDADMAYAAGSCAKKIERQGIPVRWMKCTNLMHHKFCLIDTLVGNEMITPFVMMGSLNWTYQALNGNWEDVTVTSQWDLVQQYQAEFERLWILFKPIIDFTK